VHRWTPHAGETDQPRLIPQQRSLARRPIAPSRQMEGPLDALDDLRLPRAIATSSARHTVEHHLTAHNLAGRFHEIVGYGEYGSWGRFLADECQGRTDGSADAGTTASILTVMLDNARLREMLESKAGSEGKGKR
jgi:hypothetical protein